MHIVINTILTILFLLILPCIMGFSFERAFIKTGSCKVINIPRCLTMGIALMLATFQLVAVPMTVIGTTFHTLLYVWISVITVYTCITICLNYKYVRDNIKFSLLNVKSCFFQIDKYHLAISCLAILLICFEVCLLIFRTHIDTDDARFIAEALEAYEKNSLLRIHPITGDSLDFPIGEMLKDLSSPYPIFIAAISTLTRIHPAIMAHAVLPVLLIPLAYIVSYLIADFFFDDKKNVSVFMLILALIVLFSFESIYSWGYTMLAIIWQGRSIIAVIMLPLLWYILMNIIAMDIDNNYSYKDSFGLYLALLTASLACANLSGMGGLMAPIIGCVFALACLIINRNFISAFYIGLCTTPVLIYEIIYKLLRPSGGVSSSDDIVTRSVKALIKNILNVQKSYAGTGMMMALYFVALMIIVFYYKEKKARKTVVFPTTIMLLILYVGIPAFISIGGNYSDAFSSRTFWILITPVITALGLTLFIEGIESYKMQALAITLLFPILLYSGSFKLTKDMFCNIENAYRLPQSTVDITNHILSEKESPKIIVPYTIAHPFRQLSTNLYLLYGEDATYGRITKINDENIINICNQMELKTPNLNYIIPLAKDYNVDYIVFDTVYTEFCKNGNINIYGYPVDENYVGDRTSTVEFHNLKNISVIEDNLGTYWDLSEYDLEYDGTYGQYILYRFLH